MHKYRQKPFCVEFFAWAVCAGMLAGSAVQAEPAADIEKRLAQDARYLSSDVTEGRGLGSHGLELAADYIAQQFHSAGLVTDLCQKTPFQKFSVAIDAELGPENHVALIGPPLKLGAKPEVIELALGNDYTPLAISGSSDFNLPLTFAGYGLTNDGYDDYSNVDVTGKAVIVLRHGPQSPPAVTSVSATGLTAKSTAAANSTDVGAGAKEIPYTLFRHKASNAYEHGAGAVLFCTDAGEIRGRRGQDDHVLSFHIAGATHVHSDLPVMHFRRAVIDRVLQTVARTDLNRLEEEIGRKQAPKSRDLNGWRIVGRTSIRHVQTEIKNVVAMLPGDGPNADETVVLGAHYDHLGYGSRSSLPSKPTAIYSGADDNASGVAVMLDVARRMAHRAPTPHRRVVFVAFTGEEWGFFGSTHYVNNPPVPLERTVAMINLDMVGRLKDDKLTVNCTGTGTGFSEILDAVNQRHGLKIVKAPAASGRSDQAAFYAKRIPVMHFFTGKHPDYHRPSDKFPTLNLAGMRRVTAVVEETMEVLADQPVRTSYVAVPAQCRPGDEPPPFFGGIVDITRTEPGCTLCGVIGGSPADRAGLRGGDVIVHFGKSKIGLTEDFDDALRKCTAGQRVRIRVRRGTASMAFETTLDAPK